jgi:hypothetical protein
MSRYCQKQKVVPSQNKNLITLLQFLMYINKVIKLKWHWIEYNRYHSILIDCCSEIVLLHNFFEELFVVSCVKHAGVNIKFFDEKMEKKIV